MSENPSPATPVKRKARTLEEREAALQAELANLRTQARAKDEKRLTVLEGKLDKVKAQATKLRDQQNELAYEIDAIKARLTGGEPSD